MSRTVDYKVVEMQFNNQDFEKNAKKSMETIDELKKSLDFSESAKGFEAIDDAANSVKLDGIHTALDELNNKFSSLGIVWMNVIKDVYESLKSKLGGAISWVSDSIVSGGIKRAMNIENAHFQLQALLGDEAEVQAVMDNAMESVDGTAYAYDEAAKAASMFAASGLTAGEEMIDALKGITGVAAMTNSEYEGISRIFTTVAGNGRLMGDQLLQLSSRGLNAASTIAEFYQEVYGWTDMTEAKVREFVSESMISFDDFSKAMTWAFGDSAKRANETFTGSLSNVKSALARIGAGFVSPLVEQNGEIVKLFNALRVKINEVKSELVFDEQRSAVAGLAEQTGLTKDELNEMFSTIKTNGKVTSDELTKLSDNGVDALQTLTDYFNGVNDGTIRANYATTTAIQELTDGIEISKDELSKYVEEGSVNLDMFKYAMEDAFGTETTLTKQFTDSVLNMASSLKTYITNIDVQKPLEAFYNVFEGIKNIFKGLWSIVSPLVKAFQKVFLSFSGDEMVSVTKGFADFTSQLKLSEGASEGLQKAAEAVFEVIKMIIGVIAGLISSLTDVTTPLGAVVDMFGSVLGIAGDVVLGFINWIKQSDILSTVLTNLKQVLSFLFTVTGNVVNKIREFGESVLNLESVQNIITKIKDTTTDFAQAISEKISDGSILDWIKEKFSALGEIDFSGISDRLLGFVNSIIELFSNFTLSETVYAADSIESLSTTMNKFADNNESFPDKIAKMFDFSGITSKIESVTKPFKTIFEALSGVVNTGYENLDSIMSGIASGYILYNMSNIVKNIGNFSEGLGSIGKGITNLGANIGKVAGSITEGLGSIKGAVEAYQNNLKAESIQKIAIAIGILAVSLVVLTFVDTEKLVAAAAVLVVVAGLFLFAMTKFQSVAEKSQTLVGVLDNFQKNISKSINKVATGLQAKLLAQAVKEFAIAIGIVVASIIAIGFYYSKDPAGFKAAITTVGVITGVLIAIGALLVVAAKYLNEKDMKDIDRISSALMKVTGSLLIVVVAIKMLMDIQLPNDYDVKLKILAGIFVALAAMLWVISKMTKGTILKEGQTFTKSNAADDILKICAGIIIVVKAIDMLMKINLPDDYDVKLKILAGIFTAFCVLIIALGAAANLSGGNSLKAGGTVLAMAIFVAVIVAALAVLILLPTDKLKSASIALSAILLTLAVGLAAAGKITNDNTHKVVQAMAIMVGVIALSLVVLSFISWEKLAKGAIALGAVLLAVAAALKATGKSNKSTYKTVLAMVVMVGVIALALAVLANQSWEGILTGAVSMSAVMLAVAASIKMMSGSSISGGVVKGILVAAVLMGVVALTLSFLANQPWDGMLAGAISMSIVMVAVAASIKIMNKLTINKNTLTAMLYSCILLGSIAVALYFLADQPWAGMLTGAVALGVVMLATAATLTILSNVKMNMSNMTTILAGVVLLAAVAIAIGVLAQYNWENLLAATAAISAVMLALSAAMVVCTFVGASAPAAIAGMGVMALFIAAFAAVLIALNKVLNSPEMMAVLDGGIEVLVKLGEGLGRFVGAVIGGALEEISKSLPAIAQNISQFMVNLTPFFITSQIIPDNLLEKVASLTAAILVLCAGSFIAGITSLFGLNLIGLGVMLTGFGIAIAPFIAQMATIPVTAVEAAGIIADMILKLTVADLISGISSFLGIGGDFSKFGEQLVSFGDAVTEFAPTVEDVKPEQVEGAAAAAQIMAALADDLPGQGGFLQSFFGEKDLGVFGDQLIAFGDAIAEFAPKVEDITASQVEGAAAAAQVMLALYDDLPRQGGFLQDFFGSQDLGDFGEQLEAFGTSLKTFVPLIEGIDASDVEGAAAAAQVMLALYENLPNQGGIMQDIFGEKDMGVFGAQLEAFGTSLVTFVDTVQGKVDTDAVEKAKKAGEMMSTLANGLPENLGFFNTLFGGGTTTIEDFGKQLKKFGTSIGEFSDEISGENALDTEAIEAATTSFQKLADLANSVTGMDTSGFAQFIEQLKNTPTDIVNNFVTTFTESASSVNTAVNGLCTTIKTNFTSGLPTSHFTTLAQGSITAMITAYNSKKPLLQTTIKLIASNTIVSTFRTNLSSTQLKPIGENIITYIIQGMNSKKTLITTEINNICEAMKTAFSTKLTAEAFKEIGANAAQGLANGIQSKIEDIKDAAIEAAEEAISSAKKALKEKSPSRVMHQVGEYFSIGMAEGIVDQLTLVAKAGVAAANEAVDPVKEASTKISNILSDGELNLNPVIRPIIDMSNIQNGVNSLNSMFNGSYNLSGNYNRLMGVQAYIGQSGYGNSGYGSNSYNNGSTATYEFNQYNYSPKALTRSEIYRQTNNQFTAFRKAVNPA